MPQSPSIGSSEQNEFVDRRKCQSGKEQIKIQLKQIRIQIHFLVRLNFCPIMRKTEIKALPNIDALPFLTVVKYVFTQAIPHTC